MNFHSTAPLAKMPQEERRLSAWVVSDGKAGMENQCLGLAEALGADITIKRVKIKQPWRSLGPYLRILDHWSVDPSGDRLERPFPDLLIASGRQSILPSLIVRRRSRAAGRPTFTVQIQTPGINPALFDLIIVPEHDKLRGPNVITSFGALHRVTAEKLASAAAQAPEGLRAPGGPRVAVLIGGDNGIYSFGSEQARQLGAQLRTLAESGARLLITPSRRTGPDNEVAIRAALAGTDAIIWDGTGPNPYFQFLGLADAVVVTADSVSMITEAASTGKPVHIVELPGGSKKFDHFHKAMRDAGMVRPFAGAIESWSYVPPDDTARAAGIIKDRMGLVESARDKP